MAVVKLENIDKRYGSLAFPAVDKVNLTIEDGEFMVLLGPSGCGKSTTLRMIAGLEGISSGRLTIDGTDMTRVAAKDRDIAMVFQSYALYPHMSVRDNLAFGLRRRKISRDEIDARVKEAARALGLDTLLDRKPHALSGGQRQRVALGRAIVRHPKVFLFDEPLSNLDAALRVNTRSELIKQHRKLGATMIYVTHDQVEAMTMGTRICIMDKGRIVQVGAPLDVYRNPANTFVASFLGSPPMNIVKGQASGNAGGVEVNALGCRIQLEGYGHLDSACQDVLFGIRPEDIHMTAPANGTVAMAEAQAEIAYLELLGAETIVGLILPTGDEVQARADRDLDLAIGQTTKVYLDPGAMFLFEADSGKVMSKSGAKAALSC